MKNSIEEDIKILDEMIENANIENMDMNDCFGGEHIEAIEHILSDYKRALKENEKLKNKLDNSRKANEFLNKKNDEIRREKSLMYSKAGNDIIKGWNLGDDFVPVQKVEDKIEKEIKYHEKNILDIENITMLKGKTAKEEAEIEFNKYAIVVLKKMLQELLEGRK